MAEPIKNGVSDGPRTIVAGRPMVHTLRMVESDDIKLSSCSDKELSKIKIHNKGCGFGPACLSLNPDMMTVRRRICELLPLVNEFIVSKQDDIKKPFVEQHVVSSKSKGYASTIDIEDIKTNQWELYVYSLTFDEAEPMKIGDHLVFPIEFQQPVNGVVVPVRAYSHVLVVTDEEYALCIRRDVAFKRMNTSNSNTADGIRTSVSGWMETNGSLDVEKLVSDVISSYCGGFLTLSNSFPLTCDDFDSFFRHFIAFPNTVIIDGYIL